MASTLKPPARYCSNSAFLIFFSGTMLLLPPAWHDAQFAWKTVSPFSRSAAMAGRPPATAARRPNATPMARGFQEEAVSCGSACGRAAPNCCLSPALLTLGALAPWGGEEAKPCARWMANEASNMRSAYTMAAEVRCVEHARPRGTRHNGSLSL